MSKRYDLLTAAVATGAAVAVHPGGMFAWVNQATNFNGGEAKLQMLALDGSTWLDITGAIATANGMLQVFVPAGASVRVFFTNGAGAPTAVTSYLCSA